MGYKNKGPASYICLFCVTGYRWEDIVLDIPGFGELAIISDSGDDGRDNTQIANDEGNTKRSKGEFVGVRFFEYEYTTATFNSIEALIVADAPLQIIIQYPSGM